MVVLNYNEVNTIALSKDNKNILIQSRLRPKLAYPL